MGPSGLKVVPVTIKFWGHVLLLCVDKNSEEGVHTIITLPPPLPPKYCKILFQQSLQS